MLADAFDAVHELLGEPPFSLVKEADATKKVEEAVTTTTTKNVVLQDGTYASVTKTETTGGCSAAAEKMSHMRKMVSGGDILLGTVVCVSLTKLALKAQGSSKDANRMSMGALLSAAGVGRLAEIKRANRVGVHADCVERLTLCCRVLLDPAMQEKLKPIFLKACQDSYKSLVARQKEIKTRAIEVDKKGRASGPDDLIQFRQLRAQAVQGGIEVDLMDADDISRAIGADSVNTDVAKLRHVYQLTGFSDPVYAEASVTVHDYDIVLEMLIINRTPNTLTNLTVELATMGDLKIVERPQSYTIGPLDERRLTANIKVSSTETGHIFGTIVFDNSSTATKSYVNLNDIQLDIMDYIRPGECTSDDFRSMWAEFEWENKVRCCAFVVFAFAFLNLLAHFT
jgi:coatomer subunit beta